MGCWDGDDLAGLIAWTVQEDGAVWRSNVCAVQVRRRGRGIGKRLKLDLIERAKAEGVRRIVSIVFWENGPMPAINYAVGAVVVPDPEQPENYRLCTVALPPAS